MFKSVGERTPLCGTLDLKWHCVDVVYLQLVYVLLPLMWLAIHLVMVLGILVCMRLLISVSIFTVPSVKCDYTRWWLQQYRLLLCNDGPVEWYNCVGVRIKSLYTCEWSFK